MSMDGSSGDDSEMSESDFEECKANNYDRLKAGKLKVRITEHEYRCPFCINKKKQSYFYQHLLDHAKGIGQKGKAKVRAKHLALARFMESDLVGTNTPLLKKMVREKDPPNRRQENRFVPTEGKTGRRVGEITADQLRNYFARFNPSNVIPLSADEDHTGTAIMDFRENLSSFLDTMEFQNHFIGEGSGRKDWFDERKPRASDLYGWNARAEDHELHSHVSEKKNALKNISDIVNERSEKKDKLVSNLLSQVNDKNESRLELQNMFPEGIQKMSQLAPNDMEQGRLADENRKGKRKWTTPASAVPVKNSSLEDVAIELKKVHGDLLRLIEEEKVEKKARLQPEEQIEAQIKLELAVQELKGALQVMNRKGGFEEHKHGL